jgi:dTDP-4-amino-4,6-dideoxygalactose transaminase
MQKQDSLMLDDIPHPAPLVNDDAPIQFFDLKTQARRLRKDIERRWLAVLDHGAYIGGPEVQELEQVLKDYAGAKHALAVASGTDALLIAMMGEDLTREDAVFLPGFTYNATCNAILVAGATPVFVDCDPHTCNMDVADLERRIAAVMREGKLRLRIILPVDLYGLPADYPKINAIAAKHDMLVLADAAQAFGGGLDNRRIGALADMTTLSFYPSKTLGGYGDGGAMLTDDEARWKRWSSIRWHGTDEQKKESIRVGVNGRLDSVQCATLLSKMSIFEDERAARGRAAAAYRARLKGKVALQSIPEGAEHAWGLFTVMVDGRDSVQKSMLKKGVPTSVYYGKPLHRHKAFAAFSPPGGLENSEKLAARVLSLPMHPYLPDAHVARVCEALLSSI